MNTLLVTGAAGQLGQRVIHHLLVSEGVSPARIVAATRSPEKLADLAAKGIEVRKADFDDAASLPAAFAGVDRLLIISTDALATPGQRLTQHKAAVDAAKQAGVKHILYTSMPNPDKSLVTFAPDHLGSENAVRTSGVGYTILRNAWYLDNYLLSLPHNLDVGKWYTSTGQGHIACIAREDCARAIAAALASNSSESAIYTLTGSMANTTEEVAAIATDITGRPLDVVQVTDEQLAQGLTGAGLPSFVVEMLVSTDANIRAGNFNLVTGDFTKLTGTEPQSLRDFLADHKARLTA